MRQLRSGIIFTCESPFEASGRTSRSSCGLNCAGLPATGGDWILVRYYPAVFIGTDIPSWLDRAHDSILVSREDPGFHVGALIDRRAGVALQTQVATGKVNKIDVCRPAGTRY